MPLLLLALALPARAEEPAAQSSAAKVHDHVAYTFRVPDGARPPSARANEASQNLNAVIDEELTGPVEVVVNGGGDAAEVKVGTRVVFRLLAADAQADGAQSMAEYAPRAQAKLDDFVTRERRRAHLQKGVLGISLAVFFAVLAWVLLRSFYRATRAFEERLERGDTNLPERVRQLGFVSERSRGLVLFGLTALRAAATVGAVYVVALATLSLFESTRPFRDRLALWAAAPFRALGERLVHGLPNLLLLVVVFVVLRGGWRAMTVGFERMVSNGEGLLAPHQVLPTRLIARAALVLGALVVLPLVLGTDIGIFTAVGLVLLAVAGLGAVPLVANVVLGLYALMSNQYLAGEWLSLRLPWGRSLSGEVTTVDFFHLRLVPELGGEVRVTHLLALLCAVDHLPSTRSLTVDFILDREAFALRDALDRLQQAAARVAKEHDFDGTPSVELRDVKDGHAHFRVALPEVPETARTQLLLALEEATRRGEA